MLIKTTTNRLITALAGGSLSFCIVSDAVQAAQPGDVNKANSRAMRVIEHWTPERIAKAIPRDLVLDERGLGYLRKPNGDLIPHGHEIAAQKVAASDRTAFAKPSGGSDTVPPLISDMNPNGINPIGSSHAFSALVTDASGVKSVAFNITKEGGITQSFNAVRGAGDLWGVDLQGFTDGSWTWTVVAKDGAKPSNTATSGPVGFTVDASGSGGDSGSSGAITNAEWTSGGLVQTAAGRIYFEMPANSKWKGPWNGYVCSGTVATDGTNGRSIIITAAHCVYDDANKAFSRNVLFIPNQGATTGTGTDLNCGNDPLGCWAPSFGVVDQEWTNKTFPNNIPWDYAYYVVNDDGSHTGAGGAVLDSQASSLAIDFIEPAFNAADDSDLTLALGYSYSEDPNFMYCAEEMSEESADNWWLPSCGLSGGASGGPWLQPGTDGDGPIISVNSWGYTNQPGMAGPKLSGTSAECLFIQAQNIGLNVYDGINDGLAGAKVNGCP